jgi:hypothetical protein
VRAASSCFAPYHAKWKPPSRITVRQTSRIRACSSGAVFRTREACDSVRSARSRGRLPASDRLVVGVLDRADQGDSAGVAGADQGAQVQGAARLHRPRADAEVEDVAGGGGPDPPLYLGRVLGPREVEELELRVDPAAVEADDVGGVG